MSSSITSFELLVLAPLFFFFFLAQPLLSAFVLALLTPILEPLLPLVGQLPLKLSQLLLNTSTSDVTTRFNSNKSINQSCIFRVVRVIKSLQNPLEVGNNLPRISDNVRERGLEQKCF